MSHVELKSIGKSFGRQEVLRDIDLAIAEGEFVVLVGPSGCGKSTLLRMVAGLETITAGTLEIGGRVMNAVEARERDIAMVFQSYALYPHMTVGENIGFPLRIRRETEEAIGPKVASTSATIGLEALLERKPRDLSGGQRQRVAMGRAIVRDPQVFLFDEPLSNLDAKLRVQMRQQIRELHRRLGSTSIYVTHDQVEAMTLADRVVLLEGGRIQQVGSPMELYSRPANTFVAGFIGSPEMNFLEARIEAEPDGPSCVLADGTALALPEGMDAPRPGPVTLAIRPEDISLGGEGIPGTVVDIELLGAETHILVETAGSRITCVLRGMHALALEERVHLVPERERFHFFDSETSARL